MLERWYQLWWQWLLSADKRLVEELQGLLISWSLIIACPLVLIHHLESVSRQLAPPYQDAAY